MSNETTSASDTGLPVTDEKLLRALTVLANGRALKNPLDALIVAHHRAYCALEEICNFDDYVDEEHSSYPLLEAETDRRSDAEQAALLAVCAYRAKTLSDAQSKAYFLMKHMRGCELLEDQVHALLRSFLPAGAPDAEGQANG